MKINVYCYDDINNPQCGGGGAYREFEIHTLLSQNHTIKFYTGNFKNALDTSKPNFTHKHLGFKTNYTLSRLSFALFATIHSLFSKADIYAIPYSMYSPVVTFLFKNKKTVILFFHITGQQVFKKYGILGYIPHLAERLVLSHAANFITLTDSMAHDIQEKRPGAKVNAGYVSFDSDLISDKLTDSNYILCFGRIDIHMKGIDILIPAFEKICPNFPDHQLIIAGRGIEKDIKWLKQRILDSKYNNRIKVVLNASSAEKKNLFHGATFVCMPSRFEGWNIAAIEAAASSKATLGTRIHGLSDAIKENETGLLAEPENIEQLAKSMETLLSNSGLRNELGKNGYVWAQQFTLERIAKIQEDFYSSVMNKQ